MFLGHFAVALAAKKAAPATSLGTTIAAAQFADLLWPVLVLAGVEQVVVEPGNTAVTPLDFVHYPYSHSLVALAAWGIAFGIVYALARKGGVRACLVIGLLVVSHWFLDVLVHRPDMPVTLSEHTKLGLGLWNSVPITVAIELLAFGAGVALYVRTTRPLDKTGRYALAGLVAFLVAIFLASVFGPPPPSAQAVAWTGVSMWLLVAWGAWIDRHREAA
jgi:membrane-bound metal-dependent hydrolase YbcI (DUF457 family)